MPLPSQVRIQFFPTIAGGYMDDAAILGIEPEAAVLHSPFELDGFAIFRHLPVGLTVYLQF